MKKTIVGQTPRIHPDAFVAETAVVAGDVTIGPRASLWYGVVARAEVSPITIGADTNIQDNSVLHNDPDFPLTIGTGVTVGHLANLHGCTIEDGCLIGMSAVVLNGCVIGRGSLVGACALVTQGTIIPPGSLVLGSPAKVIRPLRPEEAAGVTANATEYLHLSPMHFAPHGAREEATT